MIKTLNRLNCYNIFSAAAPFGGFKESGSGVNVIFFFFAADEEAK